MGILDSILGTGGLSAPKGHDIDKKSFEIKDVDKIFGQTQSEMEAAKQRGAAIAPQRQSFLTALGQTAMGTGPSFAAEQLKQAQERNLAQQFAMSQAMRGGNTAALQRQALRGQQEGAAQAGQQAAQARIQEMQQGRELYQRALGEEQQAVDQLTQKYLAMGFDVRSAQQQALADYEKLAVSQATGLAGIQAQQQQAALGARSGLLGGIISGAAGIGASLLKK